MRKWYPLLVVVLGFVVGAVMYPRLPERVPTHWNIHGEVDGWGSRAVASFLLPGVTLVTWLMLKFLPRIDPLRTNYAKFFGTYESLVNITVTMLFAIQVIVLAAASGAPVDVGRLIPAAIGVLLVVIGNMLPRARRNWWVGIRTPWTLSSDRVWDRTHRVGGYLLMGAGIVAIAAAFLPPPANFVVSMVAIMGSAFGSMIYSYFVWRQETSR